ncbi:hypothetical protein EVAR_47325_1 [Eumeta japonica]|uniref:Uncharacterized protein n=1 Tax=Eumeta variegata TaxID=151549 RepID=A0A4C1YGT6_EUMVA|nr:hypothetical protein EVAR_47325_1 [Eumeta japonica]
MLDVKSVRTQTTEFTQRHSLQDKPYKINIFFTEVTVIEPEAEEIAFPGSSSSSIATCVLGDESAGAEDAEWLDEDEPNDSFEDKEQEDTYNANHKINEKDTAEPNLHPRFPQPTILGLTTNITAKP